jgi:hypothetical protein
MRPNWEDKQAVFKLVEDRLHELEAEIVPELPPGDDDRPILPAENTQEIMLAWLWVQAQMEVDPFFERFFSNEQSAVEAALRGNPRALGDLMPSRKPDGTLVNVKRYKSIRPETATLIGEILRGERTKTGRELGKPGRPKMAEGKKLKQWPTPIARHLCWLVLLILQRWFPEQPEEVIRERALEFAASKTERVTVVTLRTHMGKNKRWRIPTDFDSHN